MLATFENQSLTDIEENWSLEDLMHMSAMFGWKAKMEKASRTKVGR